MRKQDDRNTAYLGTATKYEILRGKRDVTNK